VELDCPLHTDPEVARVHGFADVVAPVSSITTFALPPLWAPGDPPVFTNAERDAQPFIASLEPRRTGLEPPGATSFFATEMAVDYLRPVVRGDRVARVGHRLVACVPKETSVGRGAFTTWAWDVCNQRSETVARVEVVIYIYEPRPAA
jgi:hypothetical protein